MISSTVERALALFGTTTLHAHAPKGTTWSMAFARISTNARTILVIPLPSARTSLATSFVPAPKDLSETQCQLAAAIPASVLPIPTVQPLPFVRIHAARTHASRPRPVAKMPSVFQMPMPLSAGVHLTLVAILMYFVFTLSVQITMTAPTPEPALILNVLIRARCPTPVDRMLTVWLKIILAYALVRQVRLATHYWDAPHCSTVTATNNVLREIFAMEESVVLCVPATEIVFQTSFVSKEFASPHVNRTQPAPTSSTV